MAAFNKLHPEGEDQDQEQEQEQQQQQQQQEKEQEEEEDILLEAFSSSDEDESDTQSGMVDLEVHLEVGQRLEYLFNDGKGGGGFCCGTVARGIKRWPGWWKVDFDDGKQECVLIDRTTRGRCRSGGLHISQFPSILVPPAHPPSA